jgi:tetratricopeptide (TPR) repeat protein
MVAAVLVFAITQWAREPPLEPLPDVSLQSAEPAVAAIVQRARDNVEQDPRSALAWGNLGAALRAHEFGPQAEVCFRNAQRLNPTDYRWPYLLAVSLAATDAEQSLAHLREAARLGQDRAHVQLRLAETLLPRSSSENAAAAIDRALALEPENPRAQLAKAQWHFAQSQLEESRQWCERAVAGAPEKRAPRLLLAQLCRRLKDVEGEERETAALAAIPDGLTEWEDPDVAAIIALRRDRGWQLTAVDQLAAEGREPEAAGLLMELAQADDPSGDATDQLVRNLLQQGELDQAEGIIREKLQASPDSERLRFQLGVALFARKGYAAAAAEFQRAIDLKPDNVDAHYNLGHALRNTGKVEQSRDAFAAAVQLSPGHAFARANLAELLLDEGRTDEARPHVEVAARLAPRDPKVRQLLARLPAQP